MNITECEAYKYVSELCAENIEYYDGKWILRYGDESMNFNEIMEEVIESYGITKDEVKELIKAWKIEEKDRVEKLRQKQIEDVVNYPIPERVMALLQRLKEVFDINIEFNDEPVYLYNRGGYIYGMAKGFTLTHCTSSLECGPSYDYSKEIMEILKPFEFEIARSYGDNGLDTSTNWHDTFWYNDIIYSPSTKYFN